MNLFYSDDYVAMAHSIDATKKPMWVAESLFNSPVDNVTIQAPALVSRQQLERVHDVEYIQAVETGVPLNLAESSTFPWDTGTWVSELSSCGGMIAACEHALIDGVSGSLSSGFHHAARERGRSHCVFNGLAIAMFELRERGIERILHIDLDAHCGGGTFSLASQFAEYHQMDISLFSTDRYNPTGTSTLDFIETSESYLGVIQDRLNDLSAEIADFQLCIYYAGMDPHESSAFGGLPGIDADMLYRRDEMIFKTLKQYQVPCAFALGGGYLGSDLSKGELVSLHRNTIKIATLNRKK